MQRPRRPLAQQQRFRPGDTADAIDRVQPGTVPAARVSSVLLYLTELRSGTEMVMTAVMAKSGVPA